MVIQLAQDDLCRIGSILPDFGNWVNSPTKT